ncbi:hypothetical protein [Archangium lansingense]|uniref:Uncharacterized protein n=1 Tax=Archangium lansingense TaxID=2995310 RepID=A0ABT4AJ10_9BACT|nr:hypothetical protein [Archangium lansinium]MCY1080842.1 hypothetical protein [Archangium lansinium]
MSDTATSKAQTILTIVAASVLLLLLMAAGAFWRLHQRTRKAGDELVAEARALMAIRVVRPAHTDASTPGPLSQTLGPLMPELLLQKAEPRLEEPVNEQCQEVRDGKRPLAELPEACREALERGRPLMQRTLRATRTEEGGLPEGFEALGDPNLPHQMKGILALQHFLKLTAFEMRFQLEDGQADTALEHCLDGLALSRDLGHGSGLIGAMASATGYTILFRPCADALQHASPAGLKQATVALRRIREGLSPLSSAMRAERVYGPLDAFGHLLDQEQLDALPAGARAIAKQGSAYQGGDVPIFAPVLMRHALIEFMRYQEKAMPFVDRPIAERNAWFDGMERELEQSWNPIFKMGGVPDFSRLTARVDRQRAQADLLLALALVKAHRAESGSWPAALPALYPEHEVLLPTALTLQPGEAGSLVVVPEESHLQQLSAVMDPDVARLQELMVTATP